MEESEWMAYIECESLHAPNEDGLRQGDRDPGVDLMKPFRPKFTDKTYIQRVKCKF
jgi:hypothetical protein